MSTNPTGLSRSGESGKLHPAVYAVYTAAAAYHADPDQLGGLLSDLLDGNDDPQTFLDALGIHQVQPGSNEPEQVRLVPLCSQPAGAGREGWADVTYVVRPLSHGWLHEALLRVTILQRNAQQFAVYGLVDADGLLAVHPHFLSADAAYRRLCPIPVVMVQLRPGETVWRHLNGREVEAGLIKALKVTDLSADGPVRCPDPACDGKVVEVDRAVRWNDVEVFGPGRLRIYSGHSSDFESDPDDQFLCDLCMKRVELPAGAADQASYR